MNFYTKKIDTLVNEFSFLKLIVANLKQIKLEYIKLYFLIVNRYAFRFIDLLKYTIYSKQSLINIIYFLDITIFYNNFEQIVKMRN